MDFLKKSVYNSDYNKILHSKKEKKGECIIGCDWGSIGYDHVCDHYNCCDTGFLLYEDQ